MSLKEAGLSLVGGTEQPWRGVITDKRGNYIATLHHRLARVERRINAANTLMFAVDVFAKIIHRCDVFEFYELSSGDTMRFETKKRDWWRVVTLPVGNRVVIDLTAYSEYEPGPR